MVDEPRHDASSAIENPAVCVSTKSADAFPFIARGRLSASKDCAQSADMKLRPRPTTAPLLSMRSGVQLDERWQDVFRKHGQKVHRRGVDQEAVGRITTGRSSTTLSFNTTIDEETPATTCAVSNVVSTFSATDKDKVSEFLDKRKQCTSRGCKPRPSRTASSSIRPVSAAVHSRCKMASYSQRSGGMVMHKSMSLADLSQCSNQAPDISERHDAPKVRPLPFKVASDSHLTKYRFQRGLPTPKRDRARRNGQWHTVKINDEPSDAFEAGLWSIWQYRSSGGWVDFEFSANDTLEEAYVMGESLHFLRLEKGWCECDFRKMCMLQFGESFELRRIRSPADQSTGQTINLSVAMDSRSTVPDPEDVDATSMLAIKNERLRPTTPTFLTSTSWGDVGAPDFYEGHTLPFSLF